MSNKPSHNRDLHAETLDPTALANVLKQKYAELIETSVVLRKESRQLREDSKVLRRIGTKLFSPSSWRHAADQLSVVEEPHVDTRFRSE